MNEDVKKILGYLKDNIALSDCNNKILYNYVINLQQELDKKRKHLKEANRGLAKVIKRRTIYKNRCINLKHKIKELKQDNERLEEKYHITRKSYQKIVLKNSFLEDYKSRNEKASKELDIIIHDLDNYPNEQKVSKEELCKIWNILQGGDKE